MLTEDYINRFGGGGRLYGKTALQTFSQAHVMVVGLGGIGSWTVESLARSGIGAFTLVDLDDLCITNTNRQIHAHEGNYGQMKAEALAKRILEINPHCKINVELSFYSARTSEALLASQPDIVIDAIDTTLAKCHLLASCVRKGIPIFTSGGAGGKTDATKIKVSDLTRVHGDRLISSVRKELRTKYGFPNGDNKKAKKFYIPTVFSDEEMTPPQPCSLDDHEGIEPNTPKNLNCATGYGAITHVTATFGFFLSQLVLDSLKDTSAKNALALKNNS